VGSIFRTGDAAGISAIYLTGHTPTPLDRFGRPRKDVAKVALGAEKTVHWEYGADPAPIIKKLKNEGFFVVALEQAENAKDYKTVVPHEKTLIIAGNEVDGLPKEILDMSDEIAEIPMRGAKESLNVSVSVGIALFRILNI